MTEFARLRSYLDFEQSVKTKARFAHEPETEQFLKHVIETGQSRIKLIGKRAIFYRAQIGCDYRPIWIDEEKTESEEEPIPFSPKRMIPDANLVGNGRANPSGIAFLYMASDVDTAIAEVRPWINSYVSVARIIPTRNCRIIDCSMESTPSIWLEADNLLQFEGKAEPPDAATKERGVWGDISYAFSVPTTRTESALEYIPTQILAETFRKAGYDGIAYRSLLKEGGLNTVLFDIDTARVISCALHQVKRITYDAVAFEEFQ